MRIVKDFGRQINIHPLVIYFVLSPKLVAEYGQALNSLNKYTGFTRGVFRFQVVSHVGKNDDNALSANLQGAMKRFNMMVRLVDDVAGNFYYALHQVNFSKQADFIEESIQHFVVEVCKQNLRHLEERRKAYSSSSEELAFKHEVIDRMVSAFTRAISLKNYKHGVWESLAGDVKPVSREYQCGRTCLEPPRKAVAKLTEAGFTEEQAKLAANILWEMMESEFNLPSKEVSDEVATGVADKRRSSYIVREQRIRQKPQNSPVVKAEVKHIVTKVLKSGKEKKAWGVEFTIDGDVIPIHFGSKDSAMIYICTLLRTKVGENMYIHEFFRNSKGRKSRFNRNKSRVWIQAVYDVVFPFQNRGFDDWIEHVEGRKGHPLNQGKAQATKLIDDTLTDSHPDAIYYCILNTKSDQLGDTFYEIRIKPEHISIPKELAHLVDKFYEMMKMEACVGDQQSMVE